MPMKIQVSRSRNQLIKFNKMVIKLYLKNIEQISNKFLNFCFQAEGGGLADVEEADMASSEEGDEEEEDSSGLH